MDEIQFVKLLSEKGIKIDNLTLNKFKIYAKELIEYNQHTNLTAITDIRDIFLKHFYDSAILLSYHKLLKSTELLDIGSGGGFPGLVIAILRPDINVTLLDATLKKTIFLEKVAKALNLINVTIINQRAEKLHHFNTKKYDYITSRAVANLHVLLEISCQLLKIGGQLICLKANVENEILNLNPIMKKLGYEKNNQYFYLLPFENSQRSILLFKKIVKTPAKYPREYQQIKKKPL